MKWSKVTLAAALAGAIYGVPAWAQIPAQTAAGKPAGYYQIADLYTQESPSDAAGAPGSVDMSTSGAVAVDASSGYGVEGNCPAPATCECESSCCCCPPAGGGGGGLFACDLGDPFDLGSRLFAEDSGWDLGGWMQVGYHSSNDGVFNTRPGNVDLQQGYMYLEKIADGSEGVGLGGRVDVMYGTDAQNTQSFGNRPGTWDYLNGYDFGDYGWAIPQAYGEVAYKKLSVKLGHFYTLLGYQVVPATGNFFYSIPYTFNFSEAFTHTGALATYTASDEVTLYGGYTLGWDTGFDQINGGNSFLGGASVALTEKVKATYIATAGNLGWIGDDGYSHSLVVDYVINDKWEYVFQTDMIDVNNSPASGGLNYDTFGVNQYLFYTVSDCVKLGGRVEWWKADGFSVNEAAFGVNYRPMANLLLRPEVRYNWAPGGLPTVLPGANAAQDYTENTIFGMDAILTF